MKMNPKVAEALNAQVNHEMNASYSYLSMAAYFDSIDLPGFAAWFRAHSVEETEHAMRFYDFLSKRGGRITLTGMDAPKTEFGTVSEAIAAALEMEKDVTTQINALFNLAHDEKDYSTLNMLNWFLEEQIEEEDLFATVLDQVSAAENNRWNLLMLDKQLGARPAEG